MNSETSLLQRVSQLRGEFDNAFALPFPSRDQATTDYLRFYVATTSYALTIHQISGIAVDLEWTFVPSEVDDFLGLTCYRGRLIPLYDLGKILGHGTTNVVQGVLLSAQAPIGLTFSKLIGLERITSTRTIDQRVAGQAELPNTALPTTSGSHEVIQCSDGEQVAVLDLTQILAQLERRISSHSRADERARLIQR